MCEGQFGSNSHAHSPFLGCFMKSSHMLEWSFSYDCWIVGYDSFLLSVCCEPHSCATGRARRSWSLAQSLLCTWGCFVQARWEFPLNTPKCFQMPCPRAIPAMQDNYLQSYGINVVHQSMLTNGVPVTHTKCLPGLSLRFDMRLNLDRMYKLLAEEPKFLPSIVTWGAWRHGCRVRAEPGLSQLALDQCL